MGLVEELRKTQQREAVLVVIFVVACFAPGLLTLFVFQRPLLTTLNVVSLISLAGAMGLPVFAANVLVVVAGMGIADDLPGEDDNHFWVFLASMATSIVFYGSLLTSIVARHSAREFLYTLLAFQAVVAAASCVIGVVKRPRG